MKWKIVADSSCDPLYGDLETDDIKIAYVPFSITTDNHEYIDNGDIDILSMVDDFEKSKISKTACPAIGLWHEELLESENVIAITISSNLSGSYQSAVSAKNMIIDEFPNKKVVVVNSCSAGSELSLGVVKTIELINEGLDIYQIEEKLNDFFLKSHVIFALCSFNNFIKNGRVSKAAGFIATALKIWGIGVGSDDGVIDVVDKVRSEKKIISTILNNFETNGFNNGRFAISHCYNEDLANKIKDAVLEKWPNSTYMIGLMTGLCSYYAERSGVIVSYTND